ncbi:IPT/TIG domain-containing protein [Plantactinospora siamensis]|uniref:IPT/TIG domain-containing protein n=1 Tax=Plantactinospora siamensis TaxID=555372 RepID=A0ABV6NX26_9ACTN
MTRLWHGLGLGLCGLTGVGLVWVVLAAPGRRFVFTPAWSALFAGWVLLALTLVLDRLVRRQDPEPAERTARVAAQRAEAARTHAAELARRARAADRDPVAADIVAAGRVAISAAAEHTAAVVKVRRAGLKSLVVGADGRASTSKLQAALWTYAVLFVLVYMVVLGRTPLAPTSGGRYGDAFAAFLAAGFRPEYVALLGLPVAGAVAAQGITTGKVVSQQLLKAPPTARPGVARGLAETVSNDAGETDLLDLQYFGFNAIALLYFFVSFATTSAVDPGRGLPTIPATLLALSGVSTTAYLVKKQLESGLAPVITAVTPMRVVLGVDRRIVIGGDGFLAEGRPVNSAFNQVLLDGRPLPTDENSWSRSTVTAVLPAETDRAALERLGWRQTTRGHLAALTVRDDRGTSSPLVEIEVHLPARATAPADPTPPVPAQPDPAADQLPPAPAPADPAG